MIYISKTQKYNTMIQNKFRIQRTRWSSGSFRSDDVFSDLQSEKIQEYNTSRFREFQYLN